MIKNKAFFILLILFYTITYTYAQTTSGDIILEYIENGELENLKKYIKKMNIDVNIEYDGGWTLLMIASSNGYLDIVEYLINDKSAPVNYASTFYNQTSLMNASAEGHLDVVKYLLDRGGDINAFNKRGDTALISAIENGHTEIVKYLIEKNADIGTPSVEGTPLEIARKKGNKEIIKQLEKVIENIGKHFIEKDYSIKDIVYLSKNSLILVLESKEKEPYGFEGYSLILLKNKNNTFTKMGETKTLSLDSRCPAEGFRNIAVKGDYFTIEDSFCDGWLFVLSYATFKYDTSKGEFMLYKYSEEYIDRSAESQDISGPKHYKVEKNKYYFSNFMEEFFYKR